MEKFAVAGDTLPKYRGSVIVVDLALMDPTGEVDNRILASSESCKSMVMFAGGTGNIDDIVLNRLLCVLELCAGVDDTGPS